jgi:hypothetical protein
MISLVGGLRRRQRISFLAAPAASGPAFRSISTSQSTTMTMTVTMPAGVASGDVLVMQVAQYVDQKFGGFVSTPSGWTARQVQTIDNETRAAVFTKVAGAAETSVVFTGLVGNYIASATIMAVSDATAVDVAGTMQTYSYVAPSVTTTTSNGLLIGMFTRIDGTSVTDSFTVPASMTQRSNNRSNQGGVGLRIWSAFATETLTASGATGTRTATFPPSDTAPFKSATLLAVK